MNIPQNVRDQFEKLALQVAAAGYRKYSARTIIHRIRWHFHIEKHDDAFKCNNNWTPTLARDFMEKYPEHDKFFETRESAGDVVKDDRAIHYYEQKRLVL